VPNVPAAFSAWGMLMSDLVFESRKLFCVSWTTRHGSRLSRASWSFQEQALALLAEQGRRGS